jgi:ATP-dependent RNA helicase SUPV3L1/SUV3
MTAEPQAPSGRAMSPSRSKTVIALLGPTNTGKTHYAVERMLAHESGMIGLPLRLLAREVYDRIMTERSPKSVALITGEERIVPENPSYFVCTVEAMPLERRVACLAVDEIQLAQDPERGHTFTSRILHARGTQETLLLGAATMRGALRELIPEVQFIPRTRLSQLSHAGERKVSRLPRRSAVVAFSADQVYGFAELLRRQRGGAAVVMGALSPRTRNAQVALYQSGDVDFIVATDAIGMGLNMDIDHVAFAARRKFDGHAMRDLKPHEIGQIAGRAGRYLNDGTFGTTGEAPAFDSELVDQIENHRFDPVRVLQWRSDELDFASISTLIESLEVPPAGRALVRAKPATDLIALRELGANAEITARVTSEAHVRLLWHVCQVPDFQQTIIDDHVRMVANIYMHLTENDGRLPEDWIAGHVARLDNTEGDIDTLSARLAYIRTWTFVSNREDWLTNAAEWQERTRGVEDRLSDALHERLTQAFIDRRTSVLLKRLTQDELLNVTVDEEGEVTVEGEYVGRLSGFQFVLDPRATLSKGALEAKALRGVAMRALEPFVHRAAARLRAALNKEISLKDQGVLLFEGHAVARLKTGHSPLKPRAELMASEMVADLLGAEGRASLIQRLESWAHTHIAETLPVLVALNRAVEEEPDTVGDGPIPLGAERKTGLTGLARGIGFQLVEHFGLLPRARIADQIKALSGEDRSALRDLGVRFGEFSIFLPALLKPAQARLLVALWGVHTARNEAAEGTPPPPPPGLTSVPTDPMWSDEFLAAAGYRRCNRRVVRVDILERLGNLIRKQRFPDPVKDAPPTEQAVEPAPSNPPPLTGEGDHEVVEGAVATPEAPAGPTGDTTPASGGGEELASAAATLPTETAPTQATAPAPGAGPLKPRPGGFTVTGEMLSLAGCSGEDFADVLNALGYRRIALKGEYGSEVVIWRPARPGGEHRARSGGEPRHAPGKRPAIGGARRQAPVQAQNAPASEANNPSPVDESWMVPKHRRQGARHAERADRPRSCDNQTAASAPEKSARHDKPRDKRPPKPTFDKDSPFAVLAQLKANLEQK